MQMIRIGCGAGYAGDRIEPALELAQHGEIDYLVFECLAERTIALAQQEKRQDPSLGYDPMLASRMRAVLAVCRARGIRIITNAGAANPVAAAQLVCAIARELGLDGLTVAAVTGDDVHQAVLDNDLELSEPDGSVDNLTSRMVSANVYLGAEGVVEALAAGADVVITGRVADPSLFLAPLIHGFGWRRDDWTRLAAGSLVGHLLECAGQITGGYFADPGYKDVAGLARLGFPIAEVAEDGSAVITKVPGSGGEVSTRSCKEQLLYEIADPGTYITPDVVIDLTSVSLEAAGRDRVLVRGAAGRPRPATLKVAIGYKDSFVGEGQISYAGPGAGTRARLALQIVAERLTLTGVCCTEVRYDLIGIDALHGDARSGNRAEPYEVRARVAARTESMAEALRIGNEVETLYTNGPAGGGGAVKAAREIIGVVSAFVARGAVRSDVHFLKV